MSNYLASLSVLEKVYLACAVFGGGFFILRTILMLAGFGDTHSDFDTADAGHVDIDHGDADHGDLDHEEHLEDIDHGDHADVGTGGLKLLTIQGLTAFVMMFGLTGYALSRSSLLGSIMTIVLGVIVGFFAMWLIAKGFALMRSLQSNGTMQVYDAMGEEGTVYLTIPAEGVGKIQITISGRLTVMDAVSQDKVVLKTGERVRVSEITTGGMLAVRGI
jgi:membrane protein implicated in regulation of membrane protease activity